jgi:endo-1,4-beta-xylanase
MLRREFLSSGFAAIALQAAGARTKESLKQAAAPSGLLVGSAVSYSEINELAFAQLIARQCSIVVSENDMKWKALRPAPDKFDFTRADALVAFARKNGIKIRGHNLCWHEALPDWFQTVANPDNARELLTNHIETVVRHFKGKIHSWDVVNEAVDVQDMRADGLRRSPWLNMIGPEYLVIAFKTAAKADPGAILTYNEYGLAQDGARNEAKRHAVVALLRWLKRNGAPVQALGIQSHLNGNRPFTGLQHFLGEIRELGLRVFVTELDVNDKSFPPDVAERDRMVAGVYRDYLHTILEERYVDAVLTWGLSDRDSWLRHREKRAAGIARPLPFDDHVQPKPAFFAMREELKKASRRD